MPKLNPEFLATRTVDDIVAQLKNRGKTSFKKSSGRPALVKAIQAQQYAPGQTYVGLGQAGINKTKRAKAATVTMFLEAGSSTTLPAGGQVTSTGPIAVSAGSTVVVAPGGQVVGDNMVVHTPTVVQPAGPVDIPGGQPSVISGVPVTTGPTAAAVAGGKKKLNNAFLTSRLVTDLKAQLKRKGKTSSGNKKDLIDRLLGLDYQQDQNYVGDGKKPFPTGVQIFIGSAGAPIVAPAAAAAAAAPPAPIIVPTGGTMTSVDIPADLPAGGVVSFPSGGVIGTDADASTTTDVSAGTTVTVTEPAVVTQPAVVTTTTSSSSSSGGQVPPPGQERSEAEIIAAIRACLQSPTAGGGGGGGN